MEREASSPRKSPTTNGGGGVGNIPITTRSDPNSPYPTTFVTANSSSFKQVVQMLTGSSTSTTSSSSSRHRQPPSRHREQPPSSINFYSRTPQLNQHKQQGFKLYERRRNSGAAFKNMIINAHHQKAGGSFSSSPRAPEILSPSLLDFPGLTLSPVTPLTGSDQDPFDKPSPSVCSASGSSPSDEEEMRVISEKGFYLHPSPISTPRDSEPQLLPLFPLSSPRISDK